MCIVTAVVFFISSKHSCPWHYFLLTMSISISRGKNCVPSFADCVVSLSTLISATVVKLLGSWVFDGTRLLPLHSFVMGGLDVVAVTQKTRFGALAWNIESGATAHFACRPEFFKTYKLSNKPKSDDAGGDGCVRLCVDQCWRC